MFGIKTNTKRRRLGQNKVLPSDLADNGGYERRQKELENSANQVGLGKPYKYLNYLIDYAASGLTTSGGYNIANKAMKGYKFM